MGGHDRRIAKLEGALPVQPIISEDQLSLVGIVLGSERASQLRGGYEALVADERQRLIVAIDAELSGREAAGMAQ